METHARELISAGKMVVNKLTIGYCTDNAYIRNVIPGRGTVFGTEGKHRYMWFTILACRGRQLYEISFYTVERKRSMTNADKFMLFPHNTDR